MDDPKDTGPPGLYRNRWSEEPVIAPRPTCTCLDPQYDEDLTEDDWSEEPLAPAPSDPGRWQELLLHAETQDTSCRAWQRLLNLVEEAAKDGRREFSPGREMEASDWIQFVTLPPTIAKLKSVEHLILYGSSLVRIPPEIGEMTALRQFSPYTSYRLHWFPYEITRCKELCDSTISTRALYGNYKYRLPFPRLPQLSAETMPDRCSVCDGPFEGSAVHQAWISLRVATDVVPLLVHACSSACLDRLPQPPDGYASAPHSGGLELVQPPPQ